MTYSYGGRLAVVTGAGSGMGRELVHQLAAAGCSVAACDLDRAAVTRTVSLLDSATRQTARVTAHVADVSDRAAVERLRESIVTEHDASQIDLLFNNAGVHGEDSFVTGDSRRWERVFSICWGAVYTPTRVFLPLLAASDRAVIVNTGSVNSFYATHGSGAPCTAYAAAKFAVRGFSEALIEDLRLNAPSVSVVLVMPGTVATGLGANSDRILGAPDPGEPSDDSSAAFRKYLGGLGFADQDLSASDLSRISQLMREVFMTPVADAVQTILGAVGDGRWRVLVGADAAELDEAVRSAPESTYEVDGPSQVNGEVLRALIGLILRLDSSQIGDLCGEIVLLAGHHRVVCELDAGVATLKRALVGQPLASVKADPTTLCRVLEQSESLAAAVAEGRLCVDGDFGAVSRLVTAVGSAPRDENRQRV